MKSLTLDAHLAISEWVNAKLYKATELFVRSASSSFNNRWFLSNFRRSVAG